MQMIDQQNKQSASIIIIGAEQAGKTSIIKSLSESDYDNSTHVQWSSNKLGNVQIDLRFHEFQLDEIDERLISELVQLDCPLIVILLFDVNNPLSFQELLSNYFIDQIITSSQQKCILLGQKFDLENEISDSNISQFLTQRPNVQYQNVSALTTKGISELRYTLFNLAKLQILQLLSHSSVGTKWQSMDDNLEEDEDDNDDYIEWGSQYSQGNEFGVKRKLKQVKNSEMEEVMKILDVYKNKQFENTKVDSSYQEEEQSLNSQFEEQSTETILSQIHHQKQNLIIPNIASTFISCDDSKQDEEDQNQSNTQRDLTNIKDQIFFNNRATNSQNNNNNQDTLLNKEYQQMDSYYQNDNNNSGINNRFISQLSSSSQCSSYSHALNKKTSPNQMMQSQNQSDDNINGNSYISNHKWEIDQIKGIHYKNDLKNLNIQLGNNSFIQNNKSSSIHTEAVLEHQRKQQQQSQNQERVYAIPQVKSSYQQQYQQQQQKLQSQNSFGYSIDENIAISSIMNQSEESYEQKSNIKTHQIHQERDKKMRYGCDKQKLTKLPSQQMKNQQEVKVQNKSEIYSVKIDLEDEKKSEQIGYVKNKSIHRSISPLNRTSPQQQSRYSINDGEYGKREQRQINSFVKKKDTQYLMDICLIHQGTKIYIDVIRGETSFQLAHKYCKKANIQPSITQVKKLARLIQQEIDNYSTTLNQSLQNVEKQVIKTNKDNFKNQMELFLKDNKNFLQDFIGIEQYQKNILQVINQNNQTINKNNSNFSKTPTKRNLLLNSKSPTPLKIKNHKF